MKELILEMEEYASLKNIPIIEKDSIAFIMKYIKKNNIKNILEIGSAIGYSTILMASVGQDVTVTTIERDEERYLEAIKNIKNFGLENRITLIFNDAFNVQIDKKFDLIFFDAAKTQNIHFFTYFEKNLEKHGTIITDNIFFHGYTYMDPEKIESRNVRGIARKIRDYVSFLEENDSYETVIKKIGDGIAVTRRK